MTWKATMGKSNMVTAGLTAIRLWSDLTERMRVAILDAYPDLPIHAHPLTIAALERHGLAFDLHLTEAGRELANWNGARP